MMATDYNNKIYLKMYIDDVLFDKCEVVFTPQMAVPKQRQDYLEALAYKMYMDSYYTFAAWGMEPFFCVHRESCMNDLLGLVY